MYYTNNDKNKPTNYRFDILKTNYNGNSFL